MASESEYQLPGVNPALGLDQELSGKHHHRKIDMRYFYFSRKSSTFSTGVIRSPQHDVSWHAYLS